ncbi:LysM peptidoglycan-binding domain-containing protein [Ligilactobacillus apodemi]|uniref:LysM peptidoglycan-binding domain-containing protein n=1 Tax=Ligilactobacillus apodemi TaxID=307126 RepID=UPI00214B22BF|nr:LysM peptidoglycan-binding domain-containing protein [Ligilactobacillus apodemi]MCR1902282.1 LysM peptidoglycan-binding domain-containing protein [Ligilactobacillus apodemi]
MKSRKERIEFAKHQLLSENFKSVKKATTYIGTTVLMGTAGLALNKAKAQADVVQVDQNSTANNTNSTDSSTQQNTTDTATSTSTSATSVPTTYTTSTVSVSSSYPANVRNFLNSIAGAAQQIAQQRGLYASLMIAQAVVESGWGSSYLSTSAYNLFGVKWSGSGAYIELPTQEYYNGSYQTVYDKFQRYSSYAESLSAYANVITTRFPNSTRANASNYAVAAQNLKNGVYGTYATAPDYAEKLIKVIETYNLTAYDTGGSVQGTTDTGTITTTGTTSTATATGTYTVKSGDTLYRIAQNNNMSLDTLKSLNGLTSNTIYVGQVLKVSGSTSTTTSNTSSGSQTTTPAATTNQTTSTATATGTYTVKSGDTLYRIAQNNNMSLDTLKSLNGLTSNTIYVGQVLKVSGSTSTTTSNTSSGSQTTTPATTTGTTSTATATGTYTVKSGDTLYRIAQNNNMSLDTLKSLNGLTSNTIYVGQVLKVSGSTSTTTTSTNNSQATTTNTSQTTSSATGTYTVKSGDTLYRIAQNNNMSLDTLKSLNGLTSNTIYVGQVLKVSGSTSTTTTNTSNSGQATTTNTSQTTSSATGTYTVKAGDSLYRIAQNNNMSLDSLKSLNGLTSNLIIPGQVLKVSATSSTTAITSNTSNSTQSQTTTSQTSYTVKAGDTLWSIANANQLTLSELKKLNNLSNDIIYVGQVLNVGKSSSSTQQSQSSSSTTSAAKTSEYTVKSGDSLWKIASANATTVTQLKALNNLSSDIIYVGQKLKLQ